MVVRMARVGPGKRAGRRGADLLQEGERSAMRRYAEPVDAKWFGAERLTPGARLQEPAGREDERGLRGDGDLVHGILQRCE